MPAAMHAEKIDLHDEKPASQRLEEVTCTGPELADILGFECDRRIRQLCQEGMPRSGRGLYPRNRCVQWYAQYMWNSALQDRRFSDIRTVQMKEERRAYRTQISAIKAKRAAGSYLHVNTCRRMWLRDLRKIEIELDRLAVTIADDPRLTIANVAWWGEICSRFDVARDALQRFKETRASLFRAKKFRQTHQT